MGLRQIQASSLIFFLFLKKSKSAVKGELSIGGVVASLHSHVLCLWLNLLCTLLSANPSLLHLSVFQQKVELNENHTVSLLFTLEAKRNSRVTARGRRSLRHAKYDVFPPGCLDKTLFQGTFWYIFVPFLLRKTRKMTKQEKQTRTQQQEVYSQILFLLWSHTEAEVPPARQRHTKKFASAKLPHISSHSKEKSVHWWRFSGTFSTHVLVRKRREEPSSRH